MKSTVPLNCPPCTPFKRIHVHYVRNEWMLLVQNFSSKTDCVEVCTVKIAVPKREKSALHERIHVAIYIRIGRGTTRLKGYIRMYVRMYVVYVHNHIGCEAYTVRGWNGH